ncbi:hypothetical protein [Edaphocola flava]|uniref:hypothetical protein n=1 Tax=Edaphocola flava TaxID=2499629 RepID=UPI00100A632E|nr:hypothetical protein [Edaphocola flava]
MTDKLKNLDGITDIIVLVKLKNKYSWFCSDKTFWIMDYEKYSHSFDENDNDFSERFDIGILEKKTADAFLIAMEPYRVSLCELRILFESSLPLESFNEAYGLFPKLFIDFDTNQLFSVYSELLQMELFIPIGWTGKYEEFSSRVPLEEKYWIIQDIDYLQELID